jgi:hypothetical protein
VRDLIINASTTAYFLTGLVNAILFISTHMHPVEIDCHYTIGKPTLQTTTLGFGGEGNSLASESQTSIAPSSDHQTYYEKTAKTLTFHMEDVMLIDPPSVAARAIERTSLPNPWEPHRMGVPRVPSIAPISPLTIRPAIGDGLMTPSMPTSQFVGSTPYVESENGSHTHLHMDLRAESGLGQFGSESRDVTYESGSSPTRSELVNGWDEAGLMRSHSFNNHIVSLYRINTSESSRPGVRDIESGRYDAPSGRDGRF